ncbi:MAG: J domain-containing protein [Flavobacteriales bacterium]|jgi:hypothetical protein
MSLKPYYDILGLPATASSVEVRKQYRKLAMSLHPDKNPSPEAKERFIRITDAYEILCGKKEGPFTSRHAQSKTPEKTHEERVKEAKKRFYEQQEKERIENELYFQSLFKGNKWKIIRLSALPGMIISILLIIDLFLPRHYEQDCVTHYAKDIYAGDRNVSISLIKTASSNKFWIEGINYKLYGEHPEVLIERSWIFHQPVNVISIQKIGYEAYGVYYTFYQFTLLVAILAILPFLINRYKRKTIMYTVIYHVGLCVSPWLLLLFLLMNDHWAHLLTLGFI